MQCLYELQQSEKYSHNLSILYGNEVFITFRVKVRNNDILVNKATFIQFYIFQRTEV